MARRCMRSVTLGSRLGSTLLAVLLGALLGTGALAACGGGDANGRGPAPSPPEPTPTPTLPAAAELLTDSAEVMRTVSTVRFNIVVQGELRGVPIQAAQGQLTRDGTAKGTARADQDGQVVELSFVVIGDSLYVRGPTSGFRELPATSVNLVYNPAGVLDPDTGIAAVLASGAAAEMLGRELVGGVECYRVEARFSGEQLARLVPGFTEESTGQVWISATDSRLIQAWFPGDDGSIAFQFSGFDAPADIRPPS